MVTDGFSFARRAEQFMLELHAGNYPNASTLAKAANCSTNTAQRTIERLMHEFGTPCKYDSSRKGYYLLDPNYSLPQKLPPGKDELAALLLARDLLSVFEINDLPEKLDSLWSQLATCHPQVSRDLNSLRKVFSSDSSAVSEIADAQAIRYVSHAATGQDLRIVYESPWSGAGQKIFEGRTLKVHFSDGTLYLLFLDRKARKLTLNAAFIKEYTELNHSVKIGDGTQKIDEMPGDENWLDGFGIWAGEDLKEVVIKLKAPASRYYASQRWHSSQEDSWDGDILVRKFRATISPELIRRVLSLGEFVIAVEPESLRNQVVDQAKKISNLTQ